MIQLGRFDELGSGMRNLAHYLPLYSDGAVPAFREEGMVFVSDLPLVSGKTSVEMSGKGSVKSSGKTHERIVGMLRNEPQLTIPELAEALGVSSRAVEKHIAELKEQERLARVGGRKEGRWIVTRPGEIDPAGRVRESPAQYRTSGSGKGSGKTSVEMSGKILELLTDSPQLTLPEVATILDVSTRTVERHVATLKQQTRLTRIGSRKDGRWEVVE